jgi:hypothetical protein
MTTVVIGEPTDVYYMLNYTVEELFTIGTEISWWECNNYEDALPYNDLVSLQGILTTPSGIWYNLYGVKGRDINIPPYLDRTIGMVGNEVNWWDCR